MADLEMVINPSGKHVRITDNLKGELGAFYHSDEFFPLTQMNARVWVLKTPDLDRKLNLSRCSLNNLLVKN